MFEISVLSIHCNKNIHVAGVQKKKPRGKLKMAAEAAESLLKECKSIIEKYQAKSMFFFKY